ncbi:MAG: HrpE/YscL family type III secretion apparatus protein [Candidatus Endonucleobacter bathymodioli]|uniref:Type 3 secretion system stator protein n=1 Tax=Candidatus Endonucleibacter bathymodioli TaxID=539814 RepID=A0AA90NKE0_9GAMM|nr:HrpE/YscL family type III secretion apparatus protein [Candidatus Endonucleobacter bathymodioli]
MATPFIITANNLYVDSACKVLKGSDYSTYLEAKKVIDQGHVQAGDIAEQAKVVFQQEKEKGYLEGLEESQFEQAEQILKVVSRTVNYLAGIEKSMVDILLTGVKKIIGDFDQEELAVSLVKNALQHVRNEKQVTIRVSQSQYSMIKGKISEILEEYTGVDFIDLVADPRLSMGDCIMESEIGLVETSVDVQLRAIQKRFEKINASVVVK